MNLTLSERAELWPLDKWTLMTLLIAFIPAMCIQLVKHGFDVPNPVMVGTVAGAVMFTMVMMSPAYLARWFIRHLFNR